MLSRRSLKALSTDGQTVRVVLEDSKPQTVVTVPQQAVALDQTGPYLFVVDDKNELSVVDGHVSTSGWNRWVGRVKVNCAPPPGASVTQM